MPNNCQASTSRSPFSGNSHERHCVGLGAVALAVTLLSACGDGLSFGNPENIGTFKEGSCPFSPGDLPDELAANLEGVTISCGTVTVPERYDGSSERAFELPVVCGRTGTPDSAPVFWLEGGPGAASTPRAGLFLAAFQGLGTFVGHDLCFYDQRGIGISDPETVCKSLNKPARTIAELQERFVQCADELRGRNLEPLAYNTVDSAQDIEVMRGALAAAFGSPGYEKAILYGTSYGTLLGTQALRQNPDTIETAVLDGVLPNTFNWLADTPSGQHQGLDAIFDACEQDDACNNAYPELRDAFVEVAEELAENPITDENADPILGAGDFVNGLIFASIQSKSLIPAVPRLVDAFFEKSALETACILEDILPFQELEESEEAIASIINVTAFYLIACQDNGPFTVEDIPLDNVPDSDVLRELAVQSLAAQVVGCDGLGLPAISEEARSAFDAAPPVCLLSGEFDSQTPANYGERSQEDLGIAEERHIVFRGEGHVQALGGECVNQVIDDCINRPDETPDGSCAEELPVSFDTRSVAQALDTCDVGSESTAAATVLSFQARLTQLVRRSLTNTYPALPAIR